jgi:hypothetical protein
MKGIVFDLLEQVVSGEFGEETWDTLLEKSGVEGAFTTLGSYPDEQLYRLVGAASQALNLPGDEVVRWFARKALPLMAVKFPEFFGPHKHTRAFLLTLNDVIHPEVRKVFPGADVPSFAFDNSNPAALVMYYNSKRQLCAFAIGLIEGAAAHYGEKVTIEHPECMKRGDARCALHLAFSPA